MEQYTYLIIGGGMTADAAVRGIREHDMSGSICIISQEDYPPYDRPPLSKSLWFGKPEETIYRKTEQENVTFKLGRTVTQIQRDNRLVIDDVDNVYHYQKLLIATGGTPKKLECPDEGVIYFRTLQDYHHLRVLYTNGNHFVIVGGGYIGTELAAALAMNGKKVTMVFKEPSISSKKLPHNFSVFLNAYFTEKGVQLVPEQTITSVTKKNDQYQVETSGGDQFLADGVIAGLGITPNVELAQNIQLKTDNGIHVDRYLKTSDPFIWSAGDVTNYYSPLLEKRMRTEHEDAANTMGKLAGKNMGGAREHYTYLPYFYSDLFEIGYEAIGELGTHMDIVEDWHELYRKGVIYYLKDKQVRGAILWGIWDQIEKVRELIASRETYSRDELVGLIQA